MDTGEQPGGRRPRLAWCQAETDGRPVTYAVAGEGPVLLFLHGWGLGYRSHCRSLEQLAAARSRVYAPALPGFGGTPRVIPVIVEDALGNLIRDPVALWRAAALARLAGLTRELEDLRRRGLPIVVLWGKADRLLPRASMESLCAAAGVSAEDCVTVSGHHTWLLADPGAFAEIITNVVGLGDWQPADGDGTAA